MGRTRDGHGTARPADSAGDGGQKISAANEFHALREVFAAMDTGPIVNLFTQLITVGTTIALIVCAFFVMLAGYPVHDRRWQRPGDRVCQRQPLHCLQRPGHPSTESVCSPTSR